MNPREFLEVAGALSGEAVAPTEEARSRTAVGRAYYALFNAVVEQLAALGFNLPRDASGHKLASRYLVNCGIADAQAAGKIMDSLRDERNDADYKMAVPGFDQRHALQSIARAQQALKLLDGVDRAKLQAGISDYRKKTGLGP